MHASVSPKLWVVITAAHCVTHLPKSQKQTKEDCKVLERRRRCYTTLTAAAVALDETCSKINFIYLHCMHNFAPTLRLIGLDITTSMDFLPHFFRPWAEHRAETIYLLCKALSLRNLFFSRVLEIPRHLSLYFNALCQNNLFFLRVSREAGESWETVICFSTRAHHMCVAKYQRSSKASLLKSS